jgi:hypothetical protein
MTDDLKRDIPEEDTYEIEHGLETHEIERRTDAPPAPDGTTDQPEEPNPWLKEGADAPDAADIEDPTEQR